MSDKNKADDKKPILTLVPRGIIWAISYARMYGLKKYPETGEHGWREIGSDRIRNALYRHLMYYLDDPDGLDYESGLPHLWHIAVNVAFLCELERWGKLKGSDEWIKIHSGEEE